MHYNTGAFSIHGRVKSEVGVDYGIISPDKYPKITESGFSVFGKAE